MTHKLIGILTGDVEPTQIIIEYGNGVKEFKTINVPGNYEEFYLGDELPEDAKYYYVYTQFPETMINEILNAKELTPLETSLLHPMFQQLAGAIVGLSNFDKKCMIDAINLCVDTYLKEKDLKYLDPVCAINYYRYNKEGSNEKFFPLD